MNDHDPQEMKRLLRDALRRVLMCRMPDEMRDLLETLLARPDITVYELKSAYEHSAKRLALARPRSEIRWNPTVDAARCVGCAECFSFCPHGVFEIRGGVAAVTRPGECVILCSNCMPRCPAQAISFPPQKDYAEFLHYE